MQRIRLLTKVPSRPYCTSCKKLAHGKEYCQKGNCSCTFNGVLCREYTSEQIKKINRIQRHEPEFVYSDESNDAWDNWLKTFRKH